MRSGGEPHQLAPDLVFFGVDDKTATSEFFASLRPGAVMPELPTKDRLPTLARPEDIQPPPSSYPPIMVSSAKKAPSLTSVNLGTITSVVISTSFPMIAHKDRINSVLIGSRMWMTWV